MRASEVSVATRWRIWTLTLLVAAVAVAAVTYDVSRRAARMQVVTTPAASAPQAMPGTLVKAVVKLESTLETGICVAELLDRIDDTTYRRTQRHIDVVLTKETKVVMGSSSDMIAGAIVHVTGTIDGERRLRASQVVILSGYVRETPG